MTLKTLTLIDGTTIKVNLDQIVLISEDNNTPAIYSIQLSNGGLIQTTTDPEK